MSDDLELSSLSSFIGTEHYYSTLGTNVTDGIKYISENGYNWLVNDALAAIKGIAQMRAEPFLAVKLSKTDRSEADLIIDDGNEHELYRQHYGYTDARRNLTLYFADNVLMLSSEY